MEDIHESLAKTPPENADLRGMDRSGRDLTHVVLYESQLDGVSLRGADLYGSNRRLRPGCAASPRARGRPAQAV